jgi:thiamine-monophosphate kinase
MTRPEFELINWIRSQVVDRGSVVLGIGDDAAILRPATDRDSLIAIDMLMEGTHFRFPPATARLAGRKALAVNLSDIAAMGGTPKAAFVSVALPQDRGMEFAKEVHTGLIELADEYDVIIAGGDTNSWMGPLVISVTVVGEPISQRPICRSGARPGDWVFVTGALGGSLPSGRHLTFPPRLVEVRELLQCANIHAMIDVSDGLAADLHHILDASQVGAVIDAERIPLTEIALRSSDRQTALQHGLSDGEDFELLFTVAPEEGRRLIAEWKFQTPITHIGEISHSRECWLRNFGGQNTPLAPIGWTHPLS